MLNLDDWARATTLLFQKSASLTSLRQRMMPLKIKIASGCDHQDALLLNDDAHVGHGPPADSQPRQASLAAHAAQRSARLVAVAIVGLP